MLLRSDSMTPLFPLRFSPSDRSSRGWQLDLDTSRVGRLEDLDLQLPQSFQNCTWVGLAVITCLKTYTN